MGKVYRSDRKSVQRIKAKEIVPGDIVEVSGEASFHFFLNTDLPAEVLTHAMWSEHASGAAWEVSIF